MCLCVFSNFHKRFHIFLRYCFTSAYDAELLYLSHSQGKQWRHSGRVLCTLSESLINQQHGTVHMVDISGAHFIILMLGIFSFSSI